MIWNPGEGEVHDSAAKGVEIILELIAFLDRELPAPPTDLDSQIGLCILRAHWRKVDWREVDWVVLA